MAAAANLPLSALVSAAPSVKLPASSMPSAQLGGASSLLSALPAAALFSGSVAGGTGTSMSGMSGMAGMTSMAAMSGMGGASSQSLQHALSQQLSAFQQGASAGGALGMGSFGAATGGSFLDPTNALMLRQLSMIAAPLQSKDEYCTCIPKYT